MTRKLGADAFEAAVNEEEKGPSAKKFLKDGETLLVCIPQNGTYAMPYKAHSFYNEVDNNKSVNPFACDSEKNDGSTDVFDEAAAYLLAEAGKRFNRDTFVKGVTPPDPDYLLGRKLEASTRGLFGFFDLNDGGKEVVIDLASKHGKKITALIKKQGNIINQYAFEFTKTGSSSGSDYSISAYLSEPLTPAQQKAFDESNKEFNVQTYENSLFFKSKDYQLKDLVKIGFDVTKLGYKLPATNVSSDTQAAAEGNAHESAKHLAQVHDNQSMAHANDAYTPQPHETMSVEEQAMSEAVEQQERPA